MRCSTFHGHRHHPTWRNFTDYVRRAVGSCDVLLAFIGDQWVKLTDEQGRRRIDDPNDFVAKEIQVALTRDVRVIPVLVEGATLPLPEQRRAQVPAARSPDSRGHIGTTARDEQQPRFNSCRPENQCNL